MAERNTPTILLNGEEIGIAKFFDFVEGDNSGITIEYDPVAKQASITVEATGTVDGTPGDEYISFIMEGEITTFTGTEPWVMFVDGEIIDIRMTGSVVPSTTDVISNVRVNDIPLFDNLAEQPTLDVGEYTSLQEVTPDVTELLVGDLITWDVEQTGAPSTQNGGIPDVRSVSATKQSFTVAVNNFDIPLPVNYHVGDLLVCCVGTGAGQVDTLPLDDNGTAWELLFPTVSSGSNNDHQTWFGKIAIANESTLQNVTFTTGTPYIAKTYAIANALDIGGQPDDFDSAESSPAGDNLVVMPAMTSSLDNGLLLCAATARLTVGLQGTYELIDAGLIEDLNDCTTRTGANTNVAMQMGHAQIPAAADSDTFDFTHLGIDDAAANRNIVGGLILIQGPTGDSPGENVMLHIRYRPVG